MANPRQIWDCTCLIERGKGATTMKEDCPVHGENDEPEHEEEAVNDRDPHTPDDHVPSPEEEAPNGVRQNLPSLQDFEGLGDRFEELQDRVKRYAVRSNLNDEPALAALLESVYGPIELAKKRLGLAIQLRETVE